MYVDIFIYVLNFNDNLILNWYRLYSLFLCPKGVLVCIEQKLVKTN